MELRDFLVTPFFVVLILVLAWFIRPYFTDEVNRRYFLPALGLKMFGALTLGFIYQFYYGSGDTFVYHTYGSRLVWEAFTESPQAGMKLILADGTSYEGIYKYASNIYFFHDPNSYAIVRIAAIFDLITFSTYSSTALLFAILSFVGAWCFFLSFYKQYPHLHLQLALAAFFFPSVFFWGSGILKDSVTMAFLGIATYQFYKILLERNYNIWNFVFALLSLYVIYSIKIFILQAFLPSIIIWFGAIKFNNIKSTILKIIVVPFMAGLLIISAYYAVVKIGEDDARYSVKKIAETARVTAYDIRYQSGREAGSGYTLDVPEWTPLGMLETAPAAINVALFRPYLWEVRNPLMFMASLESTLLLLMTLYILIRHFRFSLKAFGNYNVLFCFVFSISFAFAVGISTFNFGSLTRYRIPLLPFYLVFLIIFSNYSKSARKLRLLETTE